jgi:hypothetical protein
MYLPVVVVSFGRHFQALKLYIVRPANKYDFGIFVRIFAQICEYLIQEFLMLRTT